MRSVRIARWAFVACAAIAIATTLPTAMRLIGVPADAARALHVLTKPLATLILALAVRPAASAFPAYARWVRAALVASCIGDALLLAERGFVPGLLAFLVAHLCYLRAFCLHARLAARIAPFVAVALAAAAVLLAVWPDVPAALRAPVAAYVAVLYAMTAQASARALARPELAGVAFAAAGGALFMLSDTLLAIHRFTLPLPHASMWILLTYWTAQALIARSASGERSQR